MEGDHQTWRHEAQLMKQELGCVGRGGASNTASFTLAVLTVGSLCVCVCMCDYKCVCVSICVCACVSICVCVCEYMCVRVCRKKAKKHKHKHSHASHGDSSKVPVVKKESVSPQKVKK